MVPGKVPLPAEFWSEVVGLVSASAQADAVKKLVVLDASDGPQKQKPAEIDVFLESSSLREWWELGAKSSNAFVPSLEWELSLLAFQRGRRMLTLNIVLPVVPGDDERIGSQGDALLRLAGCVESLCGFVGVGRGWRAPGPFTGTNSLLGYGPAVIARTADLDLSFIRQDLVSVEDIGEERTFLRVASNASLIDAVAEIRRACWPSMGLQFAPIDVHPDMIYFEGVPHRKNFASTIINRLQERMMSVDAGEIENRWVQGQKGEIALSDAAHLDRELAEGVLAMLSAWRRAATGWLPPGVSLGDDLVSLDATVEQDKIVVRHDGAPSIALTVLDELVAEAHRQFHFPRLVGPAWS